MSRRRQRPESGHPLLQTGLEASDAAIAERVRLFRLLSATAMQLRARMDRELAPHGLTTQQAALMQHVESHDPPPTATQVAQAMAVSHQNVRQLVDALVRKGFLELHTDPADRRARRLVATERHRAFWRDRNPADFDRVAEWTAPLDDTEVAATVDALMRLYLGLRQAG